MRTKTMRVRAGEPTRIIDRRGGSVPRRYEITVATPDGRPPSGSIEIQGSFWLSRKEPVMLPLENEMRVVKGFWDTLFRVTLTSDVDIDVTVR